MCLIIASATGRKPADSILMDAFTDNRDGYGIVYLKDNRLVVRKGFTYPEFFTDFERVEGPYVVHFRYATHGMIDADNTHPFRVTKHLYMAHNGILDVPMVDKDKSDTWNFAKYIVSPMLFAAQGRIDHPGLTDSLQKFIGRGNKLAFFDSKGNITIVNEKAGTVYQEMWFSNEYNLPGYNWVRLAKTTKTPAAGKGTIPATKNDWKDWKADKPAVATTEVDWDNWNDDGGKIVFRDVQQCDYCSEETNTLYSFVEGKYTSYLCGTCYTFFKDEANDAKQESYAG